MAVAERTRPGESFQDIPCLGSLPSSRFRPGWIWAVLALALVLRLPGLFQPTVGTFATKSAVYGMIARNWAAGHAPWWKPTLDDLCGGQRGLHLVEVPLSVYLSAGLWQLFGGSLEFWGKLTALGWTLAGMWWIYRLAQRWYGDHAGMGAAAVMACSPVSMIYGQSFMLEPSVAALSAGYLYFLDQWLARPRWTLWTLAVVCGLCLFLTKIYMLFLALPTMCLLWQADRKRRLPWWQVALAAALAVGPAVGW